MLLKRKKTVFKSYSRRRQRWNCLVESKPDGVRNVLSYSYQLSNNESVKRNLSSLATHHPHPPTTTHTQVGIPRKSITRGCIILHFYQQCVSVPVAPYRIQHLVWSLFNFSHSNSLWWYLIVIFNLFSPDDYWCWAFFHVLMCYLYIFTYSLIFLVMCLFKSFTHLY